MIYSMPIDMICVICYTISGRSNSFGYKVIAMNEISAAKQHRKHILAFGDSNTWGLIPGSKPQKRFPPEIRWTGILESENASVRIIEEGLCGRTTAFEDAERPGRNGAALLPVLLESHRPLDAAILMLGTNDCKTVYANSPETIGNGIRLCLDALEQVLRPQHILLVSPILLEENVWQADKDPEFDRKSVETCRGLAAVYRSIAAERGTAFLNAADYVRAGEADAEHMDAEGHRRFAAAVAESLRACGVFGSEK